jgi:phosphatidylglycerophosphatase A
MKSPYGILLDDIVSGIIANFIVRLLLKFNILPI